jgi:hypothetical protein
MSSPVAEHSLAGIRERKVYDSTLRYPEPSRTLES